MRPSVSFRSWFLLLAVGAGCLAALVAPAPGGGEDKKDIKLAEPIKKGQQVFSCGHSFHVWVPGIMTDMAKKADIDGHKQVGVSSIGGSRVIQHWDIAD